MAERGRPRSFDRAKALEAALQVFWRQGYEGASLADLTAAMGINSPSLYACFGSKEGLFRAAVELYVATSGLEAYTALERAPTARAGVEAMLRLNVRNFTRPGRPAGCLVVLGDRNSPTEHDSVRDFLAQHRRDSAAAMRRRLERGIAEGDLPPGIDCKAVADFYTTVLHGQSMQARDGTSPEAMHRIVDCAMAAWDALTLPPPVAA